MTDKFTVNWQAADGYLSGSRPQSFKIRDVSDLGLDSDSSDEAIRGAILEAAHEDMLQKVSADVDNLDEAAAWVRGKLAEQS